jgi:predicted lipoprotein with Yx(FWY)xxD motif
MHKTAATRLSGFVAAALLAGLIAAFFATRSNGAADSARLQVVKTAKNATLNASIIVNRRGLTLYTLSVERKGHFICTTHACLALWKPLVVPKGRVPSGAAHLATVRRPDGRTQVAYRGHPLYRFALDAKPGDVKGNGFKDVGVWRPATVSASAPSSGGNGGSYGGGYGGGY